MPTFTGMRCPQNDSPSSLIEEGVQVTGGFHSRKPTFLLTGWLFVNPSVKWNRSCNLVLERGIKMQTQAFTFGSSPFVPVAIGFFGLGTGYFIWGGQALFGFPKNSPEVNRSLWGFWMPDFMQFLTGIYLLTGLTWFNVFGKAAPLYMAGLAFTAYGIHWFAMAYRRYIDSSAQADGWMAISFLFLSILGVDVFGVPETSP
jgi:hypothetical protein